MIKVALIEFDYHAEVLRNTLHILDQEEIEVHVFTSQKIWEQVDWKGNNPKLSLQQKEQSFATYLNQQVSSINACQVVLFNTVASNFKKWIDIGIKPTKLLRIHNANAYFNKLSNAFKPKFTPFYLWKDSSHLVRKTIGEREDVFRRKFISGVEHFLFPSEGIRKYATNNYQLSTEQCWTLPFGFWKEAPSYLANTGDKFKVSIIGRVDQRNRDYDLVVESMTSLLPFLEENNLHLELVLLGMAQSSYGRQISKSLGRLTSKYFTPTTFSGFVSQDKFDQHIRETDFFIIPTKIDTRYTIYQEKYGFTKISGSINDVIKYHKPAIINSAYPVDQDMSPVFEKYNSSDHLTAKIQEWMTSKAYEKFDFEKHLDPYRLDSIKATYLNAFRQIIKD